MHIRVLGSAAGGGFPQWNCNCRNCAGVRAGALRALPRTQSSIAVSADGRAWVLCNASPDIRAQLASFPPLQPGRKARDTGVVAVVLVDAQIDHTAGLLVLRESTGPLTLHCTGSVYADLRRGLPLIDVLEHYCGSVHRPIPLGGESFEVRGAAGLRFTAVPLQGKAPPYSPNRQAPRRGDNIGLFVEDLGSGGRLFYAPGIEAVDDPLRAYFAQADCLLVDGTFWREDELPAQGLGHKRARDMGHLALDGPGGMLEQLRAFTRPRKVLIHINNSNPILDEDSVERARLAAEGIEVAQDGMDIRL